MRKDDKLYLIHMTECIQRIESYTVGGQAEFMKTGMIQDAVVRNLQVMAESSQRVSGERKNRHPEIEWYKISGFRNILVHDYLGLDLATVWAIVANELPKLKQTLQGILDES